MLRTLLVILLISFLSPSFAQDTTQHHGSLKIRKKYKESDYWPQIAGKFDGKITPAELCSEEGIYTVYPLTIVSFEMKSSYIRDSVQVISDSNTLTDEMCKIVTAIPSGAVIHFENIYAVDEKGRKVRLNSLRYILEKPPVDSR